MQEYRKRAAIQWMNNILQYNSRPMLLAQTVFPYDTNLCDYYYSSITVIKLLYHFSYKVRTITYLVCM